MAANPGFTSTETVGLSPRFGVRADGRGALGSLGQRRPDHRRDPVRLAGHLLPAETQHPPAGEQRLGIPRSVAIEVDAGRQHTVPSCRTVRSEGKRNPNVFALEIVR